MACHLAVPASRTAFIDTPCYFYSVFMRVTDSMITSFKEKYEKEANETLTMAEARDATARLYQLLEIILDEIWQLDSTTLAKFREQVTVKDEMPLSKTPDSSQ
jgi:hypothetical protein